MKSDGRGTSGLAADRLTANTLYTIYDANQIIITPRKNASLIPGWSTSKQSNYQAMSGDQ